MSERIRILELRSVYGTGGGPEKTILLGTEQAERSRFAVTVCYIRDLRDAVFGIGERATHHDIDYVEVRERHSFDIGIWNQLTQLVRKRSIDIVHAHEYKTDLIALLLARATGVIPLATAHGWTGQSPKERFVYYPLDKRLLAWFPRVIAVSSDIQHQLVKHGANPERVTVVLNSIDPAMFRRREGVGSRVRQELGLAADDVVIGSVGRLERQKRFDLLLEAFAEMRRANPALRLVIVGDGSLRSSLIEHARALGVETDCRFTGHRTDISALHHALDLFVQSSEYEGTPNSVLEAMALETPIVATDAGGSREIAMPDVHGLIVPCHDVPALTEAMLRALADPAAARRRAAAARRRIETELSFDARTRCLERIYEELMADRRPRTPRSAAVA